VRGEFKGTGDKEQGVTAGLALRCLAITLRTVRVHVASRCVRVQVHRTIYIAVLGRPRVLSKGTWLREIGPPVPKA
jgi:hypothetical protein